MREGGIQKEERGNGKKKRGTMLWSLTPVAKGQRIKKPKAENIYSGPFNKAKGTGRGFSVTHTPTMQVYTKHATLMLSINTSIIAA